MIFKPGSEPVKKDDKPKTSFSFGMPAVSSAPPVTNPNATTEKAQTAAGFSFGIPPADSVKPEAAKFSFGVPKSEPAKSLFGVAAESSKDSAKLPLSAVFSHNEGSWECKDCYSRNEGKYASHVTCNTRILAVW